MWMTLKSCAAFMTTMVDDPVISHAVEKSETRRYGDPSQLDP
jgi:hypothetical protein